MKKIAETVIGSKIGYSIMSNKAWRRDGTKTLFVSRQASPGTAYHQSGISQCYCAVCDSIFTTGNDRTYEDFGRITCPGCGTVHNAKTICHTNKPDTLLPSRIKLKLYEYKNKVELRLEYHANRIGINIYNTLQDDILVNETFTFDTLNNTASWNRISPGNVEQEDIGYITKDFAPQGILNKSVLSFYTIDNTIRKGDKISTLLRKLRETINRQEKRKGYTPKNLYVKGTNKYKFLGNILNYAHRVRFWDFSNVPRIDEETDIRLRVKYSLEKLPPSWLQDIWKNMDTNHVTLVKAMENQFHLNNCKTISANITDITKTANVIRAFTTIKDINQASRLYDYLAQRELNREKLRAGLPWYYRSDYLDRTKENIFEFIDKIYLPYYPKCDIQKAVAHKHLTDILLLFEELEPPTLKQFKEKPPRLKDLHDWLSRAIVMQENKEKTFDIPDHIKARFEMQINNYALSVVPTYSELKKLAMTLKNCAAGYRNQLDATKQIVAVTDDKGKIIAALEIDHNKLIQAKLYGNNEAFTDKTINAVIKEFVKKTGLIVSTSDIADTKQEEKLIA